MSWPLRRAGFLLLVSLAGALGGCREIKVLPGITCSKGVCAATADGGVAVVDGSRDQAIDRGNGSVGVDGGGVGGEVAPTHPPDARPADGADCFDGDAQACSCGTQGGGTQVCKAGKWVVCGISCDQSGLKGSCATGVRTCDATKMEWGDCSINPQAADTCAKNADETCNGVINEGCDCVAAATRTCDMDKLFGPCAKGVETCSAGGRWGACSIIPGVKDTCDVGNDANCNGIVNEGCPCVKGATRTCDKGGLFGPCAMGTQACDDMSKWSGCTIAAGNADTCERSNDANCNGTANDGCACISGDTRTCDKDRLFGSCAKGTETCDKAGHWSACSITPATADSCAPNADENCNGTVNEGCVCINGQMQACAGAKGTCAGGKQSCVAGRYGACSVPPVGADTCAPGNDDTCNGVANEGCKCTDGSTTSCAAAGFKGHCATGTATCNGGQWTGCPASIGADTCDTGNDNNCNGVVNENCPCVNGATRKCSQDNLFGACANGNESCSGGKWSGCDIQSKASDTCDSGNDNSCNGRANEGCTCLNGATRTCGEAGNKGRCATGSQTCAGGQWGPACPAPQSSDHCDSISNDDNCNGTPFQSCSCVNGTPSTCPVCRQDQVICANGGFPACPVYPPSDVAHCGPSCLNCTAAPPHGGAICNGAGCDYSCGNGYTRCEGRCATSVLACGRCGGWDFDDSSLQGWTRSISSMQDGSTALFTVQSNQGHVALASGFASDGSDLRLIADFNHPLCAGNNDLSGKSISFDLNLDGTGPNWDATDGTANVVLSNDVDGTAFLGTFVPPQTLGAWKSYTLVPGDLQPLGGANITALNNIAFDFQMRGFTGAIRMDNIRITP